MREPSGFSCGGSAHLAMFWNSQVEMKGGDLPVRAALGPAPVGDALPAVVDWALVVGLRAILMKYRIDILSIGIGFCA